MKHGVHKDYVPVVDEGANMLSRIVYLQDCYAKTCHLYRFYRETPAFVCLLLLSRHLIYFSQFQRIFWNSSWVLKNCHGIDENYMGPCLSHFLMSLSIKMLGWGSYSYWGKDDNLFKMCSELLKWKYLDNKQSGWSCYKKFQR